MQQLITSQPVNGGTPDWRIPFNIPDGSGNSVAYYLVELNNTQIPIPAGAGVVRLTYTTATLVSPQVINIGSLPILAQSIEINPAMIVLKGTSYTHLNFVAPNSDGLVTANFYSE